MTLENLNVSTHELGQILGISKTRIKQLYDEGLPKAARDRWHLPAVFEWFRQRWQNQATADGTSEEQRRAQTEKIITQTKIMRGELVSIEQATALIQECCALAVTAMEHAESSIDDPEVRANARQNFDGARGTLASKLEDFATAVRDRGLDSAIDSNVARRVGRAVSGATRRRAKAGTVEQ